MLSIIFEREETLPEEVRSHVELDVPQHVSCKHQLTEHQHIPSQLHDAHANAALHLARSENAPRGAALDDTAELMSGAKTVPRYRLGPRRPCEHCGALLFAHEKRWGQLCCMKGQVMLQPIVDHLEIDVSAPLHMKRRVLALNR